jgi:hypothetical protein
VFEDPLIPIVLFLSVTGLVLALLSLDRPKPGPVRVRILKRAGASLVAPAAGDQTASEPAESEAKAKQ